MAQISLDELLTASPRRVILRVGLMVYAGLSVVSIVGLVDAFYIARLGQLALAAYAFTLTTYGIAFGFAAAVGTGVRTSVAQCLGRGDRAAAAATTAAACAVSVPLFVALGALGIAADDAIFRFCGASASDAARAASFMLPLWLVAPAMALGMIATSGLHAAGDMRTALLLIVTNLPTNVVLAPLLMFGVGPIPALGLPGAGIAAALAWLLSAGLGLYFLRKRGLFARVPPSELKARLMPVVHVALPSSVSQLTIIFSLSLLTGIVAQLGTSATAALAVYMRVTDFMLMGTNALAVGVQVVASVAIGAGNHERVRAVVTTGIAQCFAWGLGCALLFALGAGPFAALLARDPSVTQPLEQVLRIGCSSFPFFAAFIASGASLNAVMRPRSSLALSLVGSFIVLIPVLHVCVGAWGWLGFCAGLVIARLAAMLIAGAWLHRIRLLDWVYASKQLSGSVPAPRA